MNGQEALCAVLLGVVWGNVLLNVEFGSWEIPKARCDVHNLLRCVLLKVCGLRSSDPDLARRERSLKAEPTVVRLLAFLHAHRFTIHDAMDVARPQ